MCESKNLPILVILAVVAMFICYPAVVHAGLVPPPNDLCANAISISDGDTAFETNELSGTQGQDTCGTFTRDIWYIYTATCTGDVTFNTCDSNFDTELAVYDSTDCSAVVSSDTGLLECNDDFCELQSQVTVPVVSGEEYLVRVGGYDDDYGSGTLSITPKASCHEGGGASQCVDDCKQAAYFGQYNSCLDDCSSYHGRAKGQCIMGCKMAAACDFDACVFYECGLGADEHPAFCNVVW
jgi:hypothetical protein